MGEMVMKTLFDRRSVLSGLDARQKKQAGAVMLGVAVCFAFSAFTFMDFLYCLSDCIGSVVCGGLDIALRDALRSLPVFLSFFLSLSGLLGAHAFYRNEGGDILRKRAKSCAVFAVVLGAVIAFYVLAMRIAGRYLSLTEGGPSRLYPLDALLYAMLYIACGASVLAHLKRSPDFAGPCRAPIPRRGKVVRYVFRFLWLLIALYGFCGFFFGLFILDFSAGYVPYTLAFLLVSLVAFLSIAVWELYYNNLTEAARRAVTLPLALVSLAVSLATAATYFFTLKHNLEGPANVGFGVLPVAMSAGVNLATLLVVLTPLIVSVAAIVKGLRIRAMSLS